MIAQSHFLHIYLPNTFETHIFHGFASMVLNLEPFSEAITIFYVRRNERFELL